jgi:hypothetical protein
VHSSLEVSGLQLEQNAQFHIESIIVRTYCYTMVDFHIHAKCMEYAPQEHQIIPRILLGGYQNRLGVTSAPTKTTRYAICRSLDLARWFMQRFNLEPRDIAEYSIYDIDCTREVLRSNREAFAKIMVGAARIGNLDLMKWVLHHTNKKKVTRRMFVAIANPKTSDDYLYEKSSWGHDMARAAALGGHIETYKWIYDRFVFKRRRRHGNLIDNYNIRNRFIKETDSAVRSGCVEMIRWIREVHIHDVVDNFHYWLTDRNFFGCSNTVVAIQMMIRPKMFMMAFRSGCDEMIDYIFGEAKVLVRSKIEYMEQACLFGDLRYVKRMYEELHPYHAFVVMEADGLYTGFAKDARSPKLVAHHITEPSPSDSNLYIPLMAFNLKNNLDYLYEAAKGHADIIKWLDEHA